MVGGRDDTWVALGDDYVRWGGYGVCVRLVEQVVRLLEEGDKSIIIDKHLRVTVM